MILKDMQAVDATLSGFIHNGTYTLDAIKGFLAQLGNPQDAVRVVHVAGTSGKTSTSYYTAALLQAAGYKVGLSVSPHIDTVRERTQVNGANLPEEDYRALLGEFLELAKASGFQLSYFEVLVAFSYWVWARLGLDFAVMEVGLGGLLDGTNVITRADKVCVITDIGYDHQEILGNTLTEIATQKAGIILPGNQVFMHLQPEEVMAVVRGKAVEAGAQLTVVNETTIAHAESLPPFQQRNLSLAYAAAQFATGKAIDPTSAIALQVPGRMEVIRAKAGKQLILDGSHNEQKIGAFVEAFQQRFPNTDPVFVVSFGANRLENMRQGLALLKSLGNRVIATDFHAEQDSSHVSLEPEVIAEEATKQGFQAQIVPGGFHAAQTALAMSDLVVVIGSFYGLNDVRHSMREGLLAGYGEQHEK